MGEGAHGHIPATVQDSVIMHSNAGIVFSICGCLTFQLAVAGSIWRTVREHKQLYISQVCTLIWPTNETQLWIHEEG